ncbi:MAG: sulfatase-like hydrolase/transferase [Vicinamibacterales bacterium]
MTLCWIISKTPRMFRLMLVPTVLALAACTPPPSGNPRPARPNILLITIDTLRADRLGKGFTPTIDRLASQGARFTAARSVVPLTLPAHVSIMTGQLPPAHGVRLNGAARLADRPTLAARLKAAGYRTRAVVGAFVLDRRFGLDAGFDEYDDRIARDPEAMDRLQADRRANDVIDRALALMQDTAADRPWFLWVHLYDPHAPYDPPAEALARAGGDRYNGEIAFADAQLQRLIEAVEKRPDAARTATILLGDHGESLGEHGEPTHGMLVFEAALRVPLLFKGPGIAAAERNDPASSVDVMPTVLAIAGETATGVTGRNLLGPPDPDRESYAETQYPTVAGWSPLAALTRDRWKLLVADRPMLYDLANDPREESDLSASRTTLVQAMSARLDAIRKEAMLTGAMLTGGGKPPTGGGKPSGLPNAVSPETVERLRSLGYVAPSAAPVSAAGGINPANAMSAWAMFEESLTAINSDRTAAALPALAKIAAAYPASPIFQATYARALASTGRKKDALERFRAAVKRWPADASLYHELAVVARELGQNAEASRAEDAALALDGSAPAAHNGRGLLLAEANQHKEAAAAFAEAVRLDPTNAVYLSNLGNADRALGDLDAAATAYRRALELSPRLADAANGLGVILVQQKQPAEAIKWLELAAADPAFIEAQLNLGIALQEHGDVDRAKAQYRKVLASRGPSSRERDAAQALLAQLEKP